MSRSIWGVEHAEEVHKKFKPFGKDDPDDDGQDGKAKVSPFKKKDKDDKKKVSKAKDMSTYRQDQWATPGEKKQIRRARIANVASAAGAVAAGGAAVRYGRGGKTAGAVAGGLGMGIEHRSAKMDSVTKNPARRYLKAGGTDQIAGVNWK